MAEDPFASIAEPASTPGGADPFASIAEPVEQSTAAPQTPGFFKELLGPYVTKEGEGPVTRFLGQAGATLLQTPPAVYHAFADQPTEEEKAKFGEGETKGLKRVGLGIHRLVVDPITGAHLEDYASGKITPKAALSVAPEALGSGVGSFVAGELAGRGLSKVGQLRTEMGGLRQMGRRVTDVESGLKDTVKNAAEKHGGALEKNKAERVSTVKENLEKQRAANTKIDRERLATEEANRRITAENEAKEGPAAQRKVAEKLVDQQSVKLGEHLGKVEESVAKEANAKFDKVRAKVGNPETDPKPLTDAVKTAETEDLQEIPENIKEFRSILGHGEEVPEELQEAYTEATGEVPEGPQPITWDKLQSLKSRIDARLRKGARMNGDLKRALYRVQDTIVDTMGGMAEEHGAADLWADARKTWRQYKEDFHEPTGPSGSGSPVAAALNAVDPKNIRQPFVAKQSTVGNRAIDILRKYPQHGGNEAAALAEQMLKDHETMRNLPSKVTPKPLKEPKQAHQMPENKPAPPIPEKPVVDAAKVAREAIAKKARNWANFNARDIGILGSSVLAGTITHALGGGGLELPVAALSYEGMKYASGRLLNKPDVIEWLSKTPPEEVAALNKIPGADKVRIINALTDQAAGSKVKLSPAAKQLLGPANVARIMGASAGQSAVHNRKEALELMGR